MKRLFKIILMVLILVGLGLTFANVVSVPSSAIQRVQWYKVYDFYTGKVVDYGCEGDGTGCLLI